MARVGRSQPIQAYTQIFNLYTSPQILWYAIFDTTSGELLSLDFGQGAPSSLPAGMDYTVVGDYGTYAQWLTWDTTLRIFVPKPLDTVIDRVDDMLGDSTLTPVWAALTPDQSIALQQRIALLLGPFRYRFAFQGVDIIGAF
jgi:hypothetical protein